MKYKLLRFSLLSLLVMLCGGLAQAADPDVTYDFTGSDWTVSDGTLSNGTVSFTGEGSANFKMNSGYFMLGKSDAYINFPTYESPVSKIVVTGKSGASGSVKQNIFVGETAVSTETTGATGSNTYEIASANQAAGTQYTLKVTSNHNTQITKIEVYYADGGGGGSTKTATTVTLAEGYATSGVVGGTIDLPNATVKAGDATLNAAVTWTSSNEDVATISDGKINLLKAGTATIKASFAGDDANEASSASFSVTVYFPYTTIAAMLENITATKTNTSYTFENLLVRYVNGKYTYVTDGNDNMLFYGSNLGLVAGDIIKGNVKGQLYTYNGLPELALSASDITVEVASSNNDVIPSVIELDALANNINNYITIKNATYVSADESNAKILTFKIGENSFIAYNQFGLDATALEADKAYDITGFGSINNSTNQIYPTSITEVKAEEPAGWRDIKIDLTNGNLLEESEKVQWGTINAFGIAVAKDGTVSRVAAEAADAACVVSGKWHSNQCWASLNVTVKVEGPVKVTCGTQPWSDNPATIKVGNETVASFSNKGTLWTSSATENVVSGYYKGTDATTLTIDGGGYPTYIAIETVDPSEIPNDATVTFDAASAGAEGVAPVAQKVEIGSKVKVPANTTLFVEGKTLTAWTDGTNQYKAGDEVTVNADMTLTPVFTDNTVAFADRTAETTLVWQFGEKNGAGTLNAQGKKTILVTQATIGEAVIDVKMAIDATSGKINNVGRGDEWAQCNDGTILTIPAYKGTAVSFNSYSDGTGTTIGGVEATDKAATYEGSAETLDIVAKGMGYISNVTAVYPVPSGEEPAKVDVNVAFSIEGTECQGQLVAVGGAYKSGDDFTLPAKNFTLYKEGFTQTGWTDGENTYEMGKVVSLPEKDITFVPVFTANEVSLADRTEPVTVKFDFQRDNGAPSVQWQNQDNLIWVAQATVNGKTIDVPTNFSTNPGKFNNTNWGDWCQLNNGTKFTIPSCKGATVSVQAYNELSELTIDGQKDYTSAKTISYTVQSSAETVDVVFGSEGSYYKYIQVVLPVVQSQGGGESYDNVAATIEWPMDEPANYSKSTATPDGAFSTVAVDLGAVRLMDQNGNENVTGTSNVSSGVTFTQMRPTNNASDFVTWVVKPASGLTFTPTKVTAYIVRFGTDAQSGVTISAKAGEGDAVTLGTYTAPRNNKSQADDKYGKNADYAVNGFVEIELTEAQQTALTSGEGFSLTGTIGVGNSKAGGIAKVTVSGLVNGTVADVNKYTLGTAITPEEAGSVSVYPKADEYEEGSEVTLTATENFGYDFVNWTNAAGEEVSTDAKFKYTVTANETLTANFKAVETYELALTVDGTNDYMVTVSPAPTVVDGKNMYEAGTTVELNANQYEGLVTFTNWSDGETTSNKIVKMEDNVTLTASYAQADIIAGWDFYKAGNNGRKADFAATDNEADALSLVNTETGETSGWLDKSTVSLNGGTYEGFTGAATNWRTGTENGDVGHYHWQTKINAEAFTDINIQFQMVFNYNAYHVYDVEFSTDGENWTKAGSTPVMSRRSIVKFDGTLPDAANNQKDLYIRLIADKTSGVDTEVPSQNDGNTLAMFFITGTPKLVDDPVAPALVSSVPENGATGASASGKIVLNFDKKVQVVEGTKATLGNLELTPVVSGKVITFEYKGLDYATDYTFTLPANTVQNLTGATLADAITINFTTMARPTVEKGAYDAVVSNVDELVAAFAAAQNRADKNVRFRIFLKKGTYTLPRGANKHYKHTHPDTGATLYDGDQPDPITYFNAKNVSVIGEERDATIITNTIPEGDTFEGKYGTASIYEGIGSSDVLQISGEGSYWQDVTISTGIGDALGRDIAIEDKGTKTIWKNTCLHGYQDTWVGQNDNGIYYFEGGVIRGRTDFICGKGDAYYNQVEFRQVAGGYTAVPSKPANIGWVMKDCIINGDDAVTKVEGGRATQTAKAEDADGNYTLGRPWGSGTPVALWIDTKMNVVPSAIGWNEMSNGWPKRFAEYNSTSKTGSVIDLSGRKKTFGDGHANNPELTAAEAAEFSDMSKMFGDWDPTLATEQAPAVADVQLEGTTLTWTGNNYSLLYAICKNGSVVDFTTESTFTVDDTTAKYAVRAANEMGGLNEAVEATVTTGIENVKTAEPTTTDDAIYTIQGVRVDKARKGLYIIGGRKVVIK